MEREVSQILGKTKELYFITFVLHYFMFWLAFTLGFRWYALNDKQYKLTPVALNIPYYYEGFDEADQFSWFCLLIFL